MKKRIITGVFTLFGIMLMGCFFSGCVLSGNTIDYVDADKYQIGDTTFDGNVSEIEIDWISGNVTIEPSDSGSYEIAETSNQNLKDDDRVHYYLNGDTLHIKYCAAGVKLIDTISKDLVVRIPGETLLDSIEVNNVSADFNVSGITVGNIDASTVSGNINADLSGINSFDVESVSGNLNISSPVAPMKGDFESVSGDIELTLPEDAGFTVECDSVSGDIDSEINGKLSDEKFICGSGEAQYDVETVSGGVKITPYVFEDDKETRI